MANGWTPERKARQAELIRNWKPWEQSTGPTSAEGKAASSRNAEKADPWNLKEAKEVIRHCRQALRDQRDALKRMV